MAADGMVAMVNWPLLVVVVALCSVSVIGSAGYVVACGFDGQGVLRMLRRGQVAPGVYRARVVGDPVGYNWRYLDACGGDVTEDLVREPVHVAMAEAVTVDGKSLLRVGRVGSWAWRIVGGHLGDQVDGPSLIADYGSPFDAMAAAAGCLRLVAQEQ